jgi:hypothetical protein
VKLAAGGGLVETERSPLIDQDFLKAETALIEERCTHRIKRFCARMEVALARDAARMAEQISNRFPWPVYQPIPMTYNPCCPSWAPPRFILNLRRS